MKTTRKQRLPEAKCDCGKVTIRAGSDFATGLARGSDHWRHGCGNGPPPKTELTVVAIKKPRGASR